MPGSSTSLATIAVGSTPGSRSISRRATARRQTPQTLGTSARQTEAGERSVSSSRERFSSGGNAIQARQRRLDRFTKPLGKAAGERRGPANRHLLPQDRPHAKLKRIERAGHTQSRLLLDPRREQRIEGEMPRDDVRPCIEIEEIPQPHENRRQRRGERGGKFNGQQIAIVDSARRGASRDVRRCQPCDGTCRRSRIRRPEWIERPGTAASRPNPAADDKRAPTANNRQATGFDEQRRSVLGVSR